MYTAVSTHPKSRFRSYPPTSSHSQENKTLFNELTFYKALADDLAQAKREVIIYSPFVSKYRTEMVLGSIVKLTHRNIDVFIFTRPVEEYERTLQNQVRSVLEKLEEAGAFVYCLSGAIHEKAAIIDREILYEGSLNILSQRQSREMMRRSVSEERAEEVLRYLRLEYRLVDGYKKKYERLYRSLLGDAKSNTKKTFISLFCLLLAVSTLLAILRAAPQEISTIIEFLKAFSLHTPR